MKLTDEEWKEIKAALYARWSWLQGQRNELALMLCSEEGQVVQERAERVRALWSKIAAAVAL